MHALRFLVVDDKPAWRQTLGKLLRSIDEFIEVDIAGSYQEALSCIDLNQYALATIDRSLLNFRPPADRHDEEGLSLLAKIRASEKNRYAGILLVSGFGSNDLVQQYMVKFRVFELVFKQDLSKFLDCAKSALLDSRAWRCEETAEQRLRLQVNFGERFWISSEIRGPGQSNRGLHREGPLIPLGVTSLSNRADRMSYLLRSNAWQDEARDLGELIYKNLQEDPLIADDLAAALSQSDRYSLSLQFTSPASGLGLPFELMRQEEDSSLASRFILTRKLYRRNMTLQRRLPFYKFLVELAAKPERLRILIVGANSNGQIGIVEEEAKLLEKQAKIEASRLGLDPQVKALVGDEAVYSRVVEALTSGSFHLFHFAGHSRFDCLLPRITGLVFANGSGVDFLGPDRLYGLVDRTPMQFAFLSCFLGLQGEGEHFRKVLEELTRADVPTVLGYRWMVPDHGAIDFARAFYHSLWTTLSPGQALLEARHAVGFDHEEATWAAPLLLSQTD